MSLKLVIENIEQDVENNKTKVTWSLEGTVTVNFKEEPDE